MQIFLRGLADRFRPALIGIVAGAFSAVLLAQSAPTPLTVAGITAANKVYDGSVAATLDVSSATLSGTIAVGDDVRLVTTGASGTFASAGVGTGKTVTITGLTLEGAQAVNYSLTQPTATASITAKGVTVTGVTVADKIYDGGNAATADYSASTLSGVISGDNVSLSTSSATAVFDSKAVGSNKSIVFTGLGLTGAAAGNYTLHPPAATASITRKSVAITGLSALNKVYDGSTSALVSIVGASLSGAISGDDVSISVPAGASGAFADKNVGTGKVVTVSGVGIGGADAGNYALSAITGVTGDITPKSAGISGATAVKVYDGTTAATLGGSPAVSGAVSGDNVSVVASGATGTYADKVVGTGKTVTTSGYALGGADAANYTLTQPTITDGVITQKALTVSGLTATDKVYDQSTAATIAGTPVLNGVVGSDVVSVVTTVFGGTFADKNVGSAKVVTISGITLGGADAANYSVGTTTTSASITKRVLSVSGFTASNKVYDATTTAQVSGGSVAGVLGGDLVSLATTASAAFDSKNVGTGKTVTISGLALSGSDAGNYNLAQASATATADITARNLTMSGLTASKVYDGTTAASVGGSLALVGALSGDAVAIDASGASVTFSDKIVGTGKSIAATGFALSGADAANYTLTQPTGTGTITAKTLTASGIRASDKVYDRTTSATLGGTGVLNGVVPGDDVSLVTTAASGAFADKQVGANKTVTISGLTLGGADAGNYVLSAATTTASISKKDLTVSGFTAAGKVYDGTTTAQFTAGNLDGVISGDGVNFVPGAAALFDTKNVGTGKTVTISGLGIAGTDAANYNLTQVSTTATADITAKNLTISGLTAGKVYDGNATVTLGGTAALVGKIATDDVALVSTGVSAAFADKVVGAGKAVTVTGFTVSGADAGNYTLAQPALTGDITAKSLAVAGITAANKVYDGNTTATIDVSAAALSGIVTGDTVTLATSSAAGAFTSKTAGAGKSVAISGLALAGADALNYVLTASSATADITAKSLTVAGLTAVTRVYDGSSQATLTSASATLVGVVSGDSVSLNFSGVTASFTTPGAGTAKPVTVTGLALAGANAGNYSLTLPDVTGDITRASATITFANLNQTYDGKEKTVQVTTEPAGLTVDLNYGANKPLNAGRYMVIATMNDTNYQASKTDTLVIAKADQTITFPAPGTPSIGKALALTATASSGLPVTFTVASGSATISGNSVTVNDAGPVVVQAVQAGDTNYNAAPAVTVSLGASKLSQTITFAAVANHGTADAPFALSATASSGLPVSFTLVSGPASLSGNTVTLSGAPGTVTIRASQAGNATYAAAADASQSFSVGATGPVIYLGSFTTVSSALSGMADEQADAVTDTLAAQVAPDFSSGTMIGFIAARNEAFVVNFQPDATGNFVATTTTTIPGAAGVARTFRGRIASGVLSGSIDGLGLVFSAVVQPASGATSSLVGYYAATALGATGASTHAIVAANGQAFVLALTPCGVEGQTTAIAADGRFAVTTATRTVISGTIDATSASVSATLAQASGATIACTGLKSTAVRTDRLVNLSSRTTVGGASRTLISGFVITGANPKAVLVRAVGPGLSAFGVRGVVSNPQLSIYRGTTLVAENRGWSTAANAAEIAAAAARVGAFALSNGSTDAVILTTLAPGAYTAQVSNSGADAVALAEIYDASVAPGTEPQRLVNVSTRGVTGAGESVLIGGFVVTGNAPKTVLIRGIGPALAGFGVDSTIADPVISVYQGSTVLGENDNWDADAAQAAQVADAAVKTGAFTLTRGSKDAAILITLAPGSYTAQVAGKAGASGVALVEIYEVQ